MNDYRNVKCEVCGVPLEEHTADCSRHEYLKLPDSHPSKRGEAKVEKPRQDWWAA